MNVDRSFDLEPPAPRNHARYGILWLSLLIGMACRSTIEDSHSLTVENSTPIGGVKHYGLGRPATRLEIERWNLDVMPDGEGGQAYLVYANFHAILDWNRSTYFALSVGLLADRVWSR